MPPCNGARVLQIQNWFYRKSKGRQCKGRQPRNFDFLQLMLNAHWIGLIQGQKPRKPLARQLSKDCKTMSLVDGSGGLDGLKSNCNYDSFLSSCLGPPTHNLRQREGARDALWQSFIFFFRDEEKRDERRRLCFCLPALSAAHGIVVGIERL